MEKKDNDLFKNLTEREKEQVIGGNTVRTIWNDLVVYLNDIVNKMNGNK